MSLQRKLLATRLNSVTFHIGLSTSTIRSCVLCKRQEHRTEMRGCHVGKKGDVEKRPRTASCASASLQRGKDFPVASKGRSVKGAVPGREEWKDAVTQDEMLPPKGQRRYANLGHMEPDAYRSVKHNIHRSKRDIGGKFAIMLPSHMAGSKNSAIFHIMWRLVDQSTATQGSLGKAT